MSEIQQNIRQALTERWRSLSLWGLALIAAGGVVVYYFGDRIKNYFAQQGTKHPSPLHLFPLFVL
jgi:hypothetical protein